MNTRNRPNLSLRWLMLAQLCLIPCASLIHAQTAPAKPAGTAAAPADPGDVIVLTPFEVVSSTKGYYASNTMSGTRFNTKLSDLASSITVMTKEQMTDFAMLDVNDIFLYVAGTEGTGTFTDLTFDRNGSISDNVQMNPTNANRVRGIAPANISLGNIETMNRVPVDPLTIDAIEVSRGPNANVFGLGNPSGTVNQVLASANLSRDKLSTTVRVDNFDGYRATIDANQALIKGKLAIRASAAFQHDGFQRKPSGVDTERYNGMIKFQPFKYTTISASVNYYHSYGNRPNAIPPRDNFSYWISKGSPTWDPTTATIHSSSGAVIATGVSNFGPYDYFSNNYLGNDRNQMTIDPTGGLVYWDAARSVAATATTPNPPTTGATNFRYLQLNPVPGAFSGTASRPVGQFLFQTAPTVSDKSIYDYSTINLSSPNRFNDRTTTSNVTVDQIIINSAEQTLAVQATFMREDSERWVRNIVGVANDNGTSGALTIDINEKRLDGTPNPYFLHPYLSVDKPRTVSQPAKWDTARAQAAYRLDLTRKESWLKHLGWFQLTAYGEHKYRVNRQYSWRDGIASDPSWIPAGTYRGFQAVPGGTPALINLTQGLYKYYVGDKGLQVDSAPGDFKYGTYSFLWNTSPTYNATTGAVITPAVTRAEPLLLDQVGSDKTGGTFNTRVRIKTAGGVVQSHLWGDRLVTTLGARYDKVFSDFGDPGFVSAASPINNYLNADGKTFDYSKTDRWSSTRRQNGGRTTNVQFVLRPFADTRITANMAKQGTGSGTFFADLLNGFSMNFNKSNSFLITAPAQDLYRNVLPNTSGSDKSWGVGFNLFDGKLVIRATRFNNFQKNAQTGDVNTLAGRVLRLDFQAPSSSGNPTPFLNLYDNAARWALWEDPTRTPTQVAAEVLNDTKFSVADKDYYVGAGSATLPIGATSDQRSVGTEVEINYNPTKFWTFSGSVTDIQAIQQNTSKALVDWIAERKAVWETIVDPSINTADAIAEGNPGKLWWYHRYSAVAATTPGAASYNATAVTPQQNFQAFVNAPLAIIAQQEGKSNPQIRRYNFRLSTNLQLSGITDNKWLKKVNVGGALRWESKAAIGYYGIADSLGIYQTLDASRPIYDKANTYVDAFVGYKTKLWNDKVTANFKLNVRNLGQSLKLQPVAAFPDGTIGTYRIIDPQQFIFSASFDL